MVLTIFAAKHNSVFTLLRNECTNLQLVRCICHDINNACSAAADKKPAAVEYSERATATTAPSQPIFWQLLGDMKLLTVRAYVFRRPVNI